MFGLAWRNISRRRNQSVLTVAITMVTVFVFVLVLGVFQVMQQGLELSSQRLGADAVLIPKYAPTQSDELLFTASPENVYMPVEVLEQAKELKGIAQMTPQFYAQTLALGCCEPGEEARIIGFDPTSDFVIGPFLGEGGVSTIASKDVILGSNMDSDIVGRQYMILGQNLFAAKQLPPTGSGMDSTLFLQIDTCRQLCLESEALSENWTKRDPFDFISVIMLRFEDGVDPQAFVKQVEDSGIAVRCVLTSETISSLQKQLSVMAKLIFALWMASLVISAMALFGRFNALARERRKEIGLLRAIGIRKPQVFKLVIFECCTMSLIGGILGSLAALFSMKSVIDSLKDAFLLSPSVWTVQLAAVCGMAGVLLALLLGGAAALAPAIKSSALDPQAAITQGEA